MDENEEIPLPRVVLTRLGRNVIEQFIRKPGKRDRGINENQSLAEERDLDIHSDDSIPSDDDVHEKQNSMKLLIENYFKQSRKKMKRSSQDQAKVKNFKLDAEGWQQMLLKVPRKHVEEINLLHHHHHLLFDKWHFLLSEGLNILLYGLGSKIQILDEFCKGIDKNSITLVVNGFFPGLTIKNILNTITEQVIEKNRSFRDLASEVSFIKEHIDGKDLYIIINNIEANLLGSEKCQAALSSLAECSHIHILASIDHVNAPLVWDQAKLSKFKWVWFDVTSFSPYAAELSYENAVLTQNQSKLALSSLLRVFNSLTPNAQDIFMILARCHYSEKDNNSYSGMPFQEFYQECRESFLVNSDLALRAQLTEFRDHKLLQLQKGSSGVELVHLLVDTNSLAEFLDMQEK